MTPLAIHDAVDAIERQSQPYAYDARVPRGASPDAAVAAAARDVLVPVLGELQAPLPRAYIDAGGESVESDYTAAVDVVPDGPRKQRGLAVARRRCGRPGPVVLALRTDPPDLTANHEALTGARKELELYAAEAEVALRRGHPRRGPVRQHRAGDAPVGSHSHAPRKGEL